MMKGADLVVYDCTYNEDEMQRFKGFGHSTWQHGVELAKMAGAKRSPCSTMPLPYRRTAGADGNAGAGRLPKSFAARDNQVIKL
jgi:hypothetical protein